MNYTLIKTESNDIWVIFDHVNNVIVDRLTFIAKRYENEAEADETLKQFLNNHDMREENAIVVHNMNSYFYEKNLKDRAKSYIDENDNINREEAMIFGVTEKGFKDLNRAYVDILLNNIKNTE